MSWKTEGTYEKELTKQNKKKVKTCDENRPDTYLNKESKLD